MKIFYKLLIPVILLFLLGTFMMFTQFTTQRLIATQMQETQKHQGIAG